MKHGKAAAAALGCCCAAAALGLGVWLLGGGANKSAPDAVRSEPLEVSDAVGACDGIEEGEGLSFPTDKVQEWLDSLEEGEVHATFVDASGNPVEGLHVEYAGGPLDDPIHDLFTRQYLGETDADGRIKIGDRVSSGTVGTLTAAVDAVWAEDVWFRGDGVEPRGPSQEYKFSVGTEGLAEGLLFTWDVAEDARLEGVSLAEADEVVGEVRGDVEMVFVDAADAPVVSGWRRGLMVGFPDEDGCRAYYVEITPEVLREGITLTWEEVA